MRVLVIHAHPVASSFNGALHRTVVDALRVAGHAVDDCDLYAEGFDPVLSEAERLAYHDIPANRGPVQNYVDRVMAAEALVLVHPVWNFGFPAILKGFFDRVFLPGVSFRMEDGKVVPALTHVRRIVAVTSYGGTRWRAMLAGDPPRRLVTRVLRVTAGMAPVTYLAHYDMNRSTDQSRAAFLAKVERVMKTL
ncbi:NAD(P)H-dependent oxidoreductase [Chthonobacter albigriseus]|uniref:NAD(P)H-dependent oxidoreductase n=1 Tax=Chthonobacter albigriseus TaxID=1683161 RepID=UPI0015EFB3DF|nr:NAD(P)H-dependent oxidoreductase [Chthonobacter albigriseus]